MFANNAWARIRLALSTFQCQRAKSFPMGLGHTHCLGGMKNQPPSTKYYRYKRYKNRNPKRGNISISMWENESKHLLSVDWSFQTGWFLVHHVRNFSKTHRIREKFDTLQPNWFCRGNKMGGFYKRWYTPNGWFIMENTTWMIWGYHYFRKPPYHQISVWCKPSRHGRFMALAIEFTN